MAAPSHPSHPSLPPAPAPGRMNVDYEERVDFARLRGYRLDRAKQAMEAAGLGALLDEKAAYGLEILTRFPARELYVTNPYLCRITATS